MEINNWNGKQVAESLHVSTSKVSRCLALLDLPDDVQQQIDSGDLPKSSAYELSKLNNEASQRSLAEQASSGTLTHQQAAKAVNQHRGKPASKPRGIRQTFQADNGLEITVSSNRSGTYHEIEEALIEALEEVRLRIENNIQLF